MSGRRRCLEPSSRCDRSYKAFYPGGTNLTLATWDIVIRTPAEETLHPNTKSCARLAELTRAFAQQAAEKWNGSDDMRCLSKKLGKWMPGNKPLTVGSRPRLSAVMNAVNATLAHGPDTRHTQLPDEFYDGQVRKVIVNSAMSRIVYDK
ncbi:hypothetical protein BKA61DRAFT_679389 [Leptodontidium sp. MPI-SDFR-AT-0119]|nr:hypothetical protein BKA61DRAFT_679389 [Leptodontidium sp. MPI-SDFR-AT-0119]